MEKMKKAKMIAVVLFCVVCIVLCKKIFSGSISSVDDFRKLVAGAGVFGALVLIGIQLLQVVIPVLPGYLGCAVGAISYGPWMGFVCNYAGICLGSIIAFYLARRYGRELVEGLFSKETFEKWKRRIDESRSFKWFLFVAMLLPLFPDDLLCYLSGLTDMDEKEFSTIILLGKPWCILGYCLFFSLI